ncbi:MAG: apolipoprotein N-acyltransferase, partial [Deltaproteobacteria bacterium]|nr:apolipoprotein N-acyltransferase [Deltaproteobacteria bacterium]
VIHVIVHYGGIPLYLAIFIMMLLAAYLGLYVSIFASGVVYLKNKGIHIFAVAPFLWTTLEYAKAYLLSGFPWENLAYSQWSILPIIQIADITGIYGITFLIIIVNIALFEIIRTRFAWKSLGFGLIA